MPLRWGGKGMKKEKEKINEIKRAGAVFSIFLFVTYCYFFSATGPNQNTRYDLTRAMVEEGTFAINSFHRNTMDKSNFDGNYFSDKAPGSSFIALPVYGAAYGIATLLFGREAARTDSGIQLFLFQLVQFTTSSLPGACLGFFLFLYLSAFSGHGRIQTPYLASIFIMLGTQLFSYSTMFYGHVPAALFLFLAFFLFEREFSSSRVFMAGTMGGAAVLTEYTAFPALLILFGAALSQNYDRTGERFPANRILFFGLGLLPCTLLILLNNWIISGDILTFGYSRVEQGFQTFMDRGFFGISAPNPVVFLALLLGSYRGLFILSPVLFFWFWGFKILWQSGRNERRTAVTSSFIILYYLVLNSGYNIWWGGASAYPRHLTAAIPFFAIFIFIILNNSGKLMRYIAVFFGFASVLNGLVITSTMPQILEEVDFPLIALYDAFLDGDFGIPLYGSPFVNELYDVVHRGKNFGMIFGLSGLLSLLPLLLLWTGWCIWFLKKKPAGK